MKGHNLNLIPFGLSEKEGIFLDVAEVAQGKQCGCNCPSCKTPLIARHGQIKEWHFAHAVKATSSSTNKPCKFSFYVSVRLMARQILGENLELTLPVFQDSVSVSLFPFHGQMNTQFNITRQQRITLTNIETEQTFLEKPVDIIGHIGEFSFIIYFTHPGRKVPAEFYHPPDSHCGILAISLEQLPGLFLNAKKQGKSYLKILHNFLSYNLPSKHWVYHPRHAQRKQHALNELTQEAEKVIAQNKKEHEERMRVRQIARQEYEKKQRELEKSKPGIQLNTYNDQQSEPRTYPAPSPQPEPRANSSALNIKKLEETKEDPSKRLANFKCVLCQATWQGPDPSDSACPKCNTHLYRTFISYVDE